MALPINTNNSLVKKDDDKKVSFSAFINGKIGKALVSNAIQNPAKASRFVTSLITLVAMNPDLAKCEQATIVSAALQAESLDLPLNNQLGFGYVLPYVLNKGKKNERTVAQFQIGWKGVHLLMLRSGVIKKDNVAEIHEGELVKFNPIINDFEFSYIVDPIERAKAPIIGYYVFFETTNGYIKEMYWPIEKMQLHAETYSKGYQADIKNNTNFTYWSKSFDDMAKKTMYKQVSKFAPMSVDSQLARALTVDQAVVEEDGTLNYVDGTDNEDVIEVEPNEVTPKEAPKGSEKVDGDGVVVNEPAPQKEGSEQEGDSLADELNN